ncbi:MAG: ABC transporter permease, partial [Clostridia bacterium]|nr:ABC transporter permease [Clostridia bacterium]
KAHWGTNETLFTLMMNYVAMQIVEYFLKIADKSGSNVVGPDLLSHGWLPELFGVKYLLNIVIIIILTVVMYIYLKYSKHGYEISVVGESQKTANYIGINVKKVIIRTMALSGAICGLVGLLIVGGSSHSIDSNLVDGRGFTAIMVSWLAKFDPITMVLTTLLIIFMERGADEVTSKFGLNSDFSDIITGIILFFIIGCEFFINYQIHIRHSKKSEIANKEVA